MKPILRRVHDAFRNSWTAFSEVRVATLDDAWFLIDELATPNVGLRLNGPARPPRELYRKSHGRRLKRVSGAGGGGGNVGREERGAALVSTAIRGGFFVKVCAGDDDDDDTDLMNRLCGADDDFGPAMIAGASGSCLAEGDVTLGRGAPGERRDPGEGSLDSYFRSANSWLADKKGKAGRLLRAAPLAPPNIRGLLGGSGPPSGAARRPPCPAVPPARRPTRTPRELPAETPRKRGGVCGGSGGHRGASDRVRQTLRFWNAALFQALHVERQKHELPRSGSQRKELCTAADSSREVTESITFNLLGCLSGRMLSLGLSRRACAEFLRRQCDTGGLAEEQLEALVANMERLESAAAAE
ncbi:unnamed protein product [Lampetra fluviatilis]